MKDQRVLKDRVILIRGAGEIASGIACRLYGGNFRKILMLEVPSPLAVRRRVSFCEAVYQGEAKVETVEAVRVRDTKQILQAWEEEKIAVKVDPRAESISEIFPDILVDATIAKRNLGLTIGDAPLVIALGPGFEAGKDCHLVVETNRGHHLGRLITSGPAEADTGIPGEIGGFRNERVLRAPAEGIFITHKEIGDRVHQGEWIGDVGSTPVLALIDGVLRGLIRPGTVVSKGLKIGDIDPRGEISFCDSISEKARAIGGSILEAVLAAYNR